jgi:transposase
LQKVQLQGPGRQQLLSKHMKLLDQLEKMIATEDDWVRKTAHTNQDAQLLMTIPGIAEFSAMTTSPSWAASSLSNDRRR